MSTPYAAQIDGAGTVRYGREQWQPYGDPNQHVPGYGHGPISQPPMHAMQPPMSQYPMPYGGAPEYDVDEETVRFDRPTTRPRRRKNAVLGLITATLVASGVVGGGFFLLGRTAEAPAAAVVGDCLARSGSGAVIVPCADPQAAFTVLGRLDGRTRIEAGITACSPFPTTTDVYWQGKDGADERGLVLCLGSAKK